MWYWEEGAWCQKSRRCPVCVARCPPCPVQLCRLPSARPNLTKPVTALLPYVPICAKQIWMENSSGDARKVGNTGFTCDAAARKLGQLQISNVWQSFQTYPLLDFAHIRFLSIDHLLSFSEEFHKLASCSPLPDRGYPGSSFYLNSSLPHSLEKESRWIKSVDTLWTNYYRVHGMEELSLPA